MKKLLLPILTILTLPSTFAYIDPGTGGYLISVVWQYIVAFFAFIGASIIFFFKHKVKELWQNKYSRGGVIIFAILLIAVILFFIFKPNPVGGLV